MQDKNIYIYIMVRGWACVCYADDPTEQGLWTKVYRSRTIRRWELIVA